MEKGTLPHEEQVHRKGEHQTTMAAGSSRIVRYILFAFFVSLVQSMARFDIS